LPPDRFDCLLKIPDPFDCLLVLLTVLEKLARLQPKVARYQRALARYYQHAGQADKAKAALERANKLGTPVKE